jgi:hypothetical protein
MAYDKFLIAPINEGIRGDLKPWLIPDDAFEELNNAYVFRGRVRKRFGSTAMDTTVASAIQPLSSRLRIKLASASGTVPGSKFNVGQMFSVGSEMLTVASTGTPATMLTTGGGITGTFNTTTGAYVITGAGATDVYYYPAQPVMGFTNYETADLNEEYLYAFDTQFCYKFESNAWDRVGTAVWTGSDSQFFWTENYRGANSSDELLFVTNFNQADGIRYWSNVAAVWTTLAPDYLAGTSIISCRLIISFKDRLLFLNTIENTGTGVRTFENRCRFSQNGSPLQADAWREDIPGKGDHIDAPVKQAIVSAQIFRDRLIVFFERSTWELVYTGNQVLPFVWQQINIELGAESTFSIVPFDKAILAIGNTGVHACNGVNVERIDEKIPDEIYEFHSRPQSVFRVQGIRDYKSELVYWAIPHKDYVDIFPDRVLVYNYKDNSWSFNDDSITAFGYNTSVHEQIVAGNQEGFTFKVDTTVNRNAASMQITNITEAAGVVTLTIINHNLATGDFIAIENVAGGMTELNNNIYKVTWVDIDTITLDNPPAVTGTYTGQGTAALISEIDILTKEYNFYTSVGDRTYLAQVDFYVTRTADGQILVDSSPSTSTRSMVDDGTSSAAILGTNVLETTAYAGNALELTQDRFWHTIYFQTEGENVQLDIYQTDAMLLDSAKAWSFFEMHAMILYVMKTHTF